MEFDTVELLDSGTKEMDAKYKRCAVFKQGVNNQNVFEHRKRLQVFLQPYLYFDKN